MAASGEPPSPLHLATPGDIPADADGTVPWWKPSWTQVTRHMGWRWIHVLPLALLLLLIAGAFWQPMLWQLLIYGFKLWVLLLGLAAAAAAQGVRLAMKQRFNPFCIHCGYDLGGLPDH